MEKKRERLLWLSLPALLVCVVVLYFVLSTLQSNYAMQRQMANSQTKLEIAGQKLQANALDVETDWASYDDFLEAKVDTVAWLLDQSQQTGESVSLSALAKQWGLNQVYLTDTDGKVLESVNGAAKDMETAGLDRLIRYAHGEDDHAYCTVGDIIYYLSVREDGNYLIGGIESAEIIARQDERKTAAYSLSTVKVGNDGYVAAVDLSDNTVAYARDESLIGSPASALGMDEALTDSFSGYITVDGQEMYALSSTCAIENGERNYLLVAVVPKSEMTSATKLSVYVACLVFLLAMAMLVLYGYFVRQDAIKGRIDTTGVNGVRAAVKRSLFSVMVLSVVVIFAATCYTQALASVDRQRLISDSKLNDVEEILDDNDSRIDELTEEYNEEYSQRAQNVAASLQMMPSLVDDDKLATLAEKAHITSIFVFNKKGRVDATNTVYKDFVISGQEEDQSYEFNNILKGYTDLIVQEARVDDTVEHALMQYIGVARKDAEGMVQIGVQPARLASRLQTTGVDHVLDNIAVENGGYLYAVDVESESFVYYPEEKYIGRPVTDSGIKEASLRDDYVGWQTINGTSCFVMGVLHDTTLIFLAVPNQALMSSLLPVSLLTTLASLIFMLILGWIVIAAMKDLTGPAGLEANRSAYYETTRHNGRKQRTSVASARWDAGREKWQDLNAGKRMKRVAGMMLSVLAILLCAWILFFAKDDNSLLAFVLGHTWDNEPNLFSLTYLLIILLETIVLTTIIRTAIMLITRNLSAAAETVGRLLDSFVKYVAIFVSIYYILIFAGVDSATILASLGILTAIIGLGANSLIQDIIAGIFLVFEGDFQVGDVVSIDGWRGTVEEIGIRTTKVMSDGHDIKIFRNSAISGVVNMTRQYSLVTYDINVAADKSLEEMEKILKKLIPFIAHRIPEVVGEAYYIGVVSVGADNSAVLRIGVQCMEDDRTLVTYKLNREMKLITDRLNAGETDVDELIKEDKAAASFAEKSMNAFEDSQDNA